LGTKIIENQKSVTFVKILNSSELGQGEYDAVANVQYDNKIINASSKFKIGYMFVNIIDYTKKILRGGIKPFEINISNLWGNKIENIYGEVYLERGGNNITSFITSPLTLEPWSNGLLRGYLETESLEAGNYKLRMLVNYGELPTEKTGTLRIYEKYDWIYTVLIVIIVVLILLLLISVYLNFRAKKRK
jgi:hypothetical protein